MSEYTTTPGLGLRRPVLGEPNWGAHLNETIDTLDELTGPVINVKAYGAKGDGTTDDASAIQSAVTAAIAAGGGIVFLPSGDYSIDTAILIAGSNVTIKGAGRELTTVTVTNASSGGSGDGFRLVKAAPYYSHVTICDLTIDCSARTTLPYSNGISMQGCDFATIERVRITSPLGFGIAIGTSAGAAPYADGLTVRDVIITGERNGNDSIGGGGIQRSLFENIRIYDPAGTGVDTTNTERTVFRNITVIQTGAVTSAMWGVSCDFGWEDVVVEDCFVYGLYYGYFFGSTSSGLTKNVVLRNCRAERISRLAAWFDGLAGFAQDGIIVEGCRFSDYNRDNVATPGLQIREADNVIIQGNHIDLPANAAYAIRLTREGAGVGVRKAKVFGNILDTVNGISYEAADGGFSEASSVQIRDNRGHNPQGAATIAVGASPFTYTAGRTPEAVYISGGTVSAIAKNGRTIFAATQATVMLEPGEAVTVTYSVTPTMEKDRK